MTSCAGSRSPWQDGREDEHSQAALGRWDRTEITNRGHRAATHSGARKKMKSNEGELQPHRAEMRKKNKKTPPRLSH